MIKLSSLLKLKQYKIVELKHFHPSGREIMVSGHGIHKANFLNECIINKNSFKESKFNEALLPDQFGLSKYKDGSIIFSFNVNSINISDNKLINWVSKKGTSILNIFFRKNKIKTIFDKFNDTQTNKDDYITAYTIGNIFDGNYLDINKNLYTEKSTTLEIAGVNTKTLFDIAELICVDFKQESVLVKDNNNNKIYLVDSNKSGSYDLNNVNVNV